jgi:hypothetical protein
MGDYSSTKNAWESHYFEKIREPPKSYEGETLSVRQETGTLYVREGPPTHFGSMMPVVDVLQPGSKVKIEEVRKWRSSGYMWAKVRYAKQRSD